MFNNYHVFTLLDYLFSNNAKTEWIQQFYQSHRLIIFQMKGTTSDSRKEDTHVIQVQFCSNCDAHLFTVRHQEHKYHSHFDNIKKHLQQHHINVKRKAFPSDLYRKSPYCPPNVYYRIQTNEVVYFPEVGSFQVYFQGKKIFSKLESLKWPTPQAILSQVQKIASKNEVATSQPQASKKILRQQQKIQVESHHKRGQIFVRKLPQHDFRYSIDRRNLFKKQGNHYVGRQSMTARNHNKSQSINRSNQTARVHRRNNEEEAGLNGEQKNKKELSDEAVIQMYSKKQQKIEADNKIEGSTNLPEIPKKTKKVAHGQGNVYLQPIFPNTNVNLQSYTRQKLIIANKIHEQRRKYEAQKQQKKQQYCQKKQSKSLYTKAKFNQSSNQLLKNKQTKLPAPLPVTPADLRKIKQATEQNEIKEKVNLPEIVSKNQKKDQRQTNNSKEAAYLQKVQPQQKPFANQENVKLEQRIAFHSNEKNNSHLLLQEQQQNITANESVNKNPQQLKTDKLQSKQDNEQYNMNFQQQDPENAQITNQNRKENQNIQKVDLPANDKSEQGLNKL